MFEQEKDIHLHNYKKIHYSVSYLKKISYFREKKVYIPTLEIWGSKQCNLRCRECISRFPYLKQENIRTSTVVDSINKLNEMALLNRVVISGGEPFLNKDFYRILLCLDRLETVKKIYILTNATVIPEKCLLESLSNAAKPIKVIMNEYQGVLNKQEELKKIFHQWNIAYVIRETGNYHWNGIGNQIREMLHFETGKMIFSACKMRNYAVLCEDIITKCPRGISSQKIFGGNELTADFFRISDSKNDAFARARLAACLDKNIYKEYCRTCFGLSNENPYVGVPGVQIGE